MQQRAKPPEYVLKVSGLGVKFGGRAVLDGIDFRVERGTTLAIVGPNGSGKSTLFKALLGRVHYTGSIEWGHGTRVGYVPQNFFVNDVPISVREFLSFNGRHDITHALASVGLDAEKLLEKRLDVLSGGELQRVFIAWALLDKPDVLLFDEPTASIDIGSEEIVYEMLNKLEIERKITILLISHDVHVIRDYSDCMLALDGKMIFFGKSEEINRPHLLEAIYGSGTVLNRHKH